MESKRVPCPTGLDRRRFVGCSGAGIAGAAVASSLQQRAAAVSTLFQAQADALAAEAVASWKPRYIVGSSMYGSLYLGDILPEVQRCGAAAIDIWPKPHGNQREQARDFGDALLARMLAQHEVRLGCLTHYKLGPYGLQEEMRFAQRFGCELIVTGAVGPTGLTGGELRAAVARFVESLAPHLEVAEQTGVTIAIENHANSLIESPESLRLLAELRPGKQLAIALAPYHLPQDPQLLAQLIRDLDDALAMFYAWQHGAGCMARQPKEQELLQMPGRGPLDFAPLLEALAAVDYQGWTEIFMHPFPRGIPILETAAEVTQEINRARAYLDRLVSPGR
jgi:sugar phosphate isomerase/epimerase